MPWTCNGKSRTSSVTSNYVVWLKASNHVYICILDNYKTIYIYILFMKYLPTSMVHHMTALSNYTYSNGIIWPHMFVVGNPRSRLVPGTRLKWDAAFALDNPISHTIRGTGIFTYMNGCFNGEQDGKCRYVYQSHGCYGNIYITALDNRI